MKNRKIASLVMFTILCAYIVMPFSYIFVLSHHKYTMLESMNKENSKSIVLSFSESELEKCGFQLNDDEILIKKKHFELVSFEKSNGIIRMNVVPDTYEDILVQNKQLEQEQWLNNTCCWPFFEEIRSLKSINNIDSIPFSQSEIERKIPVPFIVCVFPPPEFVA